MATVVPLLSRTRSIADGRLLLQNRNYLFWKNGKALAGGAHKALANCLYKAESVLAQLFSDKNDKGELSINVILRADSC